MMRPDGNGPVYFFVLDMELICDVNSTGEHPSTGGTVCFERGISPVWISNDTVLLSNGEGYGGQVFRIIHFGKPQYCSFIRFI